MRETNNIFFDLFQINTTLNKKKQSYKNMGINKLNQLLKNQCPSVYKEVHLSEFAYKKVSIDVSLFMCKYKSIGECNWLESFLNLIVCLRRNDIHCVFIFDSGHPPEKVQEKEERTQAREKVKVRNDLLDTLLTKYEETDELDPVLQDVFHKLDGINHAAIITNKEVLVKVLRTAIEKKKKAIFNITPEDWTELRHLFDTMNVVYYNAPLEAECMCADLCKRGLVDAALSEDTDVLAYGSPIFLTKIDIYKNTAVVPFTSKIHKPFLPSYISAFFPCIPRWHPYQNYI